LRRMGSGFSRERAGGPSAGPLGLQFPRMQGRKTGLSGFWGAGRQRKEKTGGLFFPSFSGAIRPGMICGHGVPHPFSPQKKRLGPPKCFKSNCQGKTWKNNKRYQGFSCGPGGSNAGRRDRQICIPLDFRIDRRRIITGTRMAGHSMFGGKNGRLPAKQFFWGTSVRGGEGATHDHTGRDAR